MVEDLAGEEEAVLGLVSLLPGQSEAHGVMSGLHSRKKQILKRQKFTTNHNALWATGR